MAPNTSGINLKTRNPWITALVIINIILAITFLVFYYLMLTKVADNGRCWNSMTQSWCYNWECPDASKPAQNLVNTVNLCQPTGASSFGCTCGSGQYKDYYDTGLPSGSGAFFCTG